MFAGTSATKEPDVIAARLRELFAQVGYFPSGTVFVKPNLCGRTPILESENTTVYFMDGLLAVLREHGCQVVIGHSSLLGTPDRVYTFEQVVRDAGFAKYELQSDCSLLDLDVAPRQTVKGSERTFKLPEILFTADSYINLVLKM